MHIGDVLILGILISTSLQYSKFGPHTFLIGQLFGKISYPPDIPEEKKKSKMVTKLT